MEQVLHGGITAPDAGQLVIVAVMLRLEMQVSAVLLVIDLLELYCVFTDVCFAVFSGVGHDFAHVIAGLPLVGRHSCCLVCEVLTPHSHSCCLVPEVLISMLLPAIRSMSSAKLPRYRQPTNMNVR